MLPLFSQMYSHRFLSPSRTSERPTNGNIESCCLSHAACCNIVFVIQTLVQRLLLLCFPVIFQTHHVHDAQHGHGLQINVCRPWKWNSTSFSNLAVGSDMKRFDIVWLLLALLASHCDFLFVSQQPENEERSIVYDNIGPNVCMGDHKVTPKAPLASLTCRLLCCVLCVVCCVFCVSLGLR